MQARLVRDGPGILSGEFSRPVLCAYTEETKTVCSEIKGVYLQISEQNMCTNKQQTYIQSKGECRNHKQKPSQGHIPGDRRRWVRTGHNGAGSGWMAKGRVG